jgi:uncharacterized protein YegP (UPF0339 family)
VGNLPPSGAGRAHDAESNTNMQFELHWARSGQQHWYWLIRASNGQVLATSETYWNRQDAINAANSVKDNAASAPFYDMTKAA